ncbi:uncharacterized protein C1orf50 homolog isoform X2 [Ischnura elegans]|uniref:uncharacterized protein C1orf50 homolog isoform X2 n=1 Tax=Ischnura elegans TaxID=197161 RepID=UPI001ED87464|nr:uncharacterized protein C1orf50 homolog isoform X2 [Ischnura elegans]
MLRIELFFVGTVSLVERNPEPCGVTLVNEKAIARRAPTDLVELAREIQTADSFVKATACGKLQVIAEQVRFLQSQAQKVLEDARANSNLHHAACNFLKQPGKVYHLYERPSGQTYFSMLSPQEWGEGKCPHRFLGTFRLEHDMSWTPEEKLQERSDEFALLDKVLSSGQNVAISYNIGNV